METLLSVLLLNKYLLLHRTSVLTKHNLTFYLIDLQVINYIPDPPLVQIYLPAWPLAMNCYLIDPLSMKYQPNWPSSYKLLLD